MVRLPQIAPTFALALGLSLTGAPLLAQSGTTDAPAMSETERDALRSEIRAYLLDHPEVIFEAVAEYERRQQNAQADMDLALVQINAEDIFRDGHSWVAGNPEGDITLVEFMDYRCGYCRRAQPAAVRRRTGRAPSAGSNSLGSPRTGGRAVRP